MMLRFLRASNNAKCLIFVVEVFVEKKGHEIDLSYAGRYSKEFGRRLKTLGILNDSNQMEALKCFMCSSPAAESDEFVA
jgi:hypothetical protein